MINQQLIGNFSNFLSSNYADETRFNAIQGDFEKYIQKKFAFYLSSINGVSNIVIEKKTNKRRIDLHFSDQFNTYNIEFKSVHNDVSKTFLSSYTNGIQQISQLPTTQKNFLIIVVTHFSNSLLKSNIDYGVFDRYKKIKSNSKALFTSAQLLNKSYANHQPIVTLKIPDIELDFFVYK